MQMLEQQFEKSKKLQGFHELLLKLKFLFPSQSGVIGTIQAMVVVAGLQSVNDLTR